MVWQKTTYVTKNPEQTKKLGNLLARSVKRDRKSGQALVLALSGDLGAGKTNFIQGFARGLGIGETVNSPTFVIAKVYPVKKSKSGFKKFHHVDCYRLDDAADLAELDFEKVTADPDNIVAVEWPKIAGKFFGNNVLRLEFEVIGEEERRITINS
ncbi:MAG: tRNA (adenosine(37)-N6)-threonylcarbamoyltransferase complex ATPase subunit type 1 TsaE [Candidatus Pacebacteria bacterium]|nr:tRNA (adenosine(37)-N6)-threonylcarbamoyltransferase complex ATPase subunit type 1 TsaE [Candidatus Paceibacterota bacterium]